MISSEWKLFEFFSLKRYVCTLWWIELVERGSSSSGSYVITFVQHRNARRRIYKYHVLPRRNQSDYTKYSIGFHFDYFFSFSRKKKEWRTKMSLQDLWNVGCTGEEGLGSNLWRKLFCFVSIGRVSNTRFYIVRKAGTEKATTCIIRKNSREKLSQSCFWL